MNRLEEIAEINLAKIRNAENDYGEFFTTLDVAS